MPDDAAFPPTPDFAFPQASEEGDDSEQRNQQIQSAFDTQRFQRGMAQSLSKALSSQAAQIAQLRQREAQQKT